MIAFTRASPAGSPNTEIYTEGQLGQGGGSSVPVATRAATGDSRPDFQPVVAAQVRPKGATPMRVSLVPAFDQCTSPNATHSGPPQLNVPSCVPPRATNPDVTVGEPLVNGKGANFIGSVTIKALVQRFAVHHQRH